MASSETIVRNEINLIHGKYTYATFFKVSLIVGRDFSGVSNRLSHTNMTAEIDVSGDPDSVPIRRYSLLIHSVDFEKLKQTPGIRNHRVDGKVEMAVIKLLETNRVPRRFYSNLKNRFPDAVMNPQHYSNLEVKPDGTLRTVRIFYLPIERINQFEQAFLPFEQIVILLPVKFEFSPKAGYLSSFLDWMGKLDKRILAEVDGERILAKIPIDIAMDLYLKLSATKRIENLKCPDDSAFREKAVQNASFLRAIRERNELEALRILHTGNISPKELIIDGCSPLSRAAEFGLSSLVEELLKAQYGLDIDSTLDDGATALFIAAQYGYASVVELLLKNKANPELSVTKTVSELKDFIDTMPENVQSKMRMGLFLQAKIKAGANDLAISISPLQIAYIMDMDNQAVIDLLSASTQAPEYQIDLAVVEEIKNITAACQLDQNTGNTVTFYTPSVSIRRSKAIQDVLFMYLCFGRVDPELLLSATRRGRIGEIVQLLSSENENSSAQTPGLQS